MKKLLALLLALALGLGLALPAFAEEEPPPAVNWDDFYITAQPKSQRIAYKADFTLNVGVNIPEGVEVSYRWKCWTRISNVDTKTPINLWGSHGVPTANEATLRLSSDLHGYPGSSVPWPPATPVDSAYVCEIVGTERDADGNEISSKTLRSNVAEVRMDGSKKIGDLLYYIFVDPIDTAYYGGHNAFGPLAVFFLPILVPIFFVSNIQSLIKAYFA